MKLKKNAKLINDLQSLRHKYVDLRQDNEEKTQMCEEMLKKQRDDKDYVFIIKQDLSTANT